MSAYAILLAGVSLMPIQEPTGAIPHLDKGLHLCEYLVFAWLLLQAMRVGRLEGHNGRLGAWIGAAGYGGLMEGMQLLVPWRSADWADVVVNAAGAGLGMWLGQRVPWTVSQEGAG